MATETEYPGGARLHRPRRRGGDPHRPGRTACVLWAISILSPFIDLVLWAAVLAVGLYPLHTMLTARLGGRGKLSATAITLLLLAVVLVPSGQLVASGVVEARELVEQAQAGELAVPPPPEGVRSWPLVGEHIFSVWTRASQNLEAVVRDRQEEVEVAAKWALSALTGLTGTVGQLLISILIAGAMLNTGESAMSFAQKLSCRLAGETGADFVRLTTATIRSVFVGVLGVALIQAAGAGVGLLVIGAPGGILWALAVLICAVVQLPTIIVLLPPIVWAFATQSSFAAGVFLVWCLVVGTSDTFLKPLLMGRGVDVPMLVILLGAIGGMITSGLIGLFVGAVVLAVAYQLMMAWIEQDADRGFASDPEAG